MTEDKSTLSNEQRKELHKRMVNVEVSLLEQELLFQLRKLGHGRFIVQMLDGVPFRYQIEVSKFFEGSSDFAILKDMKGGDK